MNEYTGRGWIDSRIMRLPTIVVRSGVPSAATSAFLSGKSDLYFALEFTRFMLILTGIIREPLKGLECICPVRDSFDSSKLSLRAWLASSEITIQNFIIAKHIPAENFFPHTRVVCLPGFTATVREELEALEQVAGKDVRKLVKFKDDPVNRRIVSSWPAAFDNTYPLSLGFIVDQGGMLPIVKRFQQDIAVGIALFPASGQDEKEKDRERESGRERRVHAELGR